MRGPLMTVVAGISLLLACPSLCRAEAAADLLDQAVAAYDDLRIEDSLALLDRAEGAGDLSDEQQAQLHLFRGLGRASLGQNDEADAAFRRALALDAEITLPADISPVVVERFEALRGQAGQPDPDPDPDPDPLPDPDPDPVPPTPEQREQPPAPTRRVLTWTFLGLTAATFLGGGTALTLALVTRSQAQNDIHTASEANDMVDTYRLETRLAFGLLSASAALALGTLMAWLGERSIRRAEEREEPAISLLPSPSGLLLSGTFR